MHYQVEVKDQVQECWTAVAFHNKQESAERSRKDAWRTGCDARVVRVLSNGKREVLL